MVFLKYTVKTLLILLFGFAATGFVAGAMRAAVPEWADDAPALIYLGGVAATLAAAIVQIVAAIRRRHAPVDWNWRRFLRLVVAVAIFFVLGFAAHAIVVIYSAGRPVVTGMTGGSGVPEGWPSVVHYGGPLAALAVAAVYFLWPWLKPKSGVPGRT